MDKNGNVYSVRYTYILDGRTCHTTWVGRATSSKNAIAISSEWYAFEESGADVIDIKVELLTLNKEEGEENNNGL